MTPSIYSPLPTENFSIRLVRLQPSEDPSAPIHCKLFPYVLANSRPGAHLYECLSYVWGSPEDHRPIYVDSTMSGQGSVQSTGFSSDTAVKFEATKNLHAALAQLRDPCFERILWVDALCINQNDEDEKTQQVSAMARIYGLAQRVVVWLGEEADESASAFQKLSSLTLNHRRVGRASLETMSTTTEDRELGDGGDEEKTSAPTERAVHALLNRVYFRRMWILQEVTAARNILFKCGASELQTTTFLVGVDALTHLDDYVIRNRIRAFTLLIERSAFRESLKGQSHLNVAPLAELIDMFHAQDATDPRDKIYALWGLCSDSKLIEQLRPDYSRNWQDLLDQLGKVIFNEKGTFSASEHRQILFVRTSGYDLGKIDEVSTEGIWDNTQMIKINSMRASRYLDGVGNWSIWCKLQTSSEEIQKHDVVLFLPHAKRLVIARAGDYYCRIIKLADSRSVQGYIYQTPYEQHSAGWVSWQPSLNDITKTAKEFPLPLLWNWEKTYEHESQEALRLMSDRILDSLRSPHVMPKARGLSDMASLLMDWGDYDRASYLLMDLVDLFDSAYGPESEATIEVRTRLAAAQDKKSKYEKATNLLSRISDSHDGVRDCCADVILHVTNTICPTDSYGGRIYVPTHFLLDLASKVMSEGVYKDMLLYAVGLLEQSDIASSGSTSERRENYLHFLLDMAEGDLCISTTELLAAARRPIAESNFFRLAKRTEFPIDNLPDILESLRYRKTKGSYVRGFFAELADRVVITAEAVNVAARWDEDALSALLAAGNPTQIVTPDAFKFAVNSRYTKATIPIIELLAQYAGSDCEIPEDTLVRFAEQAYWANENIFVALLELPGPTINITERVLMVAIDLLVDNSYRGVGGILPYLRFRPDVHIKDHMFTKAKTCIHEEVREWTLSILADLKQSMQPVNQEDVDAIPANEMSGYASILNLLRYRRTEFSITKDTILRAVSTTRKEEFRNSPLRAQDYVAFQVPASWRSHRTTEKVVLLLISHASEEVIESLSQSSDMIHAVVSHGYPDVLQALRSRSKYSIHDFEALDLIAQICKSIQDPTLAGATQLPTVDDLIQKLAKTVPVSQDLKQAIFLHALRRNFYGSVLVVRMLLEQGVMGANAVNFLQETPLHLVVSLEDECPVSDGVVKALLNYGGSASIDAVDTRGRTPRQMVCDRVQQNPQSMMWTAIGKAFDMYRDERLES